MSSNLDHWQNDLARAQASRRSPLKRDVEIGAAFGLAAILTMRYRWFGPIFIFFLAALSLAAMIVFDVMGIGVFATMAALCFVWWLICGIYLAARVAGKA